MELIFRDDAYQKSCTATVVSADETGIRLDRTVFYPMGGGQPGDCGTAAPGRRRRAQDRRCASRVKASTISCTYTRRGCRPARPRRRGGPRKSTGTGATAMMRMHTCMHLLCAVITGDVTGGQVGDGKGRLDFNLPDTQLDKEAITAALNRLIEEDHPVGTALDHRRGTRGQAGTRAHHVGETALGRRQGAPAGDRGRRSAALRRHTRAPHRARSARFGSVRSRTRAVRTGASTSFLRRLDREPVPAMPDFNSDAVVSTEWLAQHLAAPDVRVVDASYYLPHEGLDPRHEYELQHIPGAVFFDIDEISRQLERPAPHAAGAGEVLLAEGSQARPRRRRAARRLRPAGPVQRAPGLVDIPALRPRRRRGAGRRAAQVDGRGAPGRRWPRTAREERHFTARTNSFMVRDKEQMRANLDSQAGNRCSTPAAGAVSTAVSRSFGRDAARATSPAASTCLTPI